MDLISIDIFNQSVHCFDTIYLGDRMVITLTIPQSLLLGFKLLWPNLE